MAAVASLQNFSDAGEILLFFLDRNRYLAMIEMGTTDDKLPDNVDKTGAPPIDGPPPPEAQPEADPDPIRIVKHPSSIGAITYKSLIRVYGIDFNMDVSQLSPVWKPVSPDSKATYSSLAAASDGREKGWLYYLGASPPVLSQYELHHDRASPVEGAGEPHPQSRLAAVYDKIHQSRIVIYQDGHGNLHSVRISQGATSDTTIRGTDNAQIKTPLAACAGGEGELYVYYINNDYRLQRVTCGPKGNWGDPESPRDCPDLSNWSQIAVTPDTQRGVNNLFYVESNGNNDFGRYFDPL